MPSKFHKNLKSEVVNHEFQGKNPYEFQLFFDSYWVFHKIRWVRSSLQINPDFKSKFFIVKSFFSRILETLSRLVFRFKLN
jgi:hypothetical protein